MSNIEKINFEDKEAIDDLPEIIEKNKITAENINDLKNTINNIVEQINGNDPDNNLLEIFSAQIQENKNSIDNVIEKIINVDFNSEALEKAINTNKTNIENNKNNINTNITNIENNKNNINTNTINIENNKNNINTNTINIENNKNNIELIKNTVNTNFDTLNTNINELATDTQNKIDNLNSIINNNSSKIQQNTNNITNQFTEIQNIKTTINENKNDINLKIDDVKNAVGTNLNNINTLNTQVNDLTTKVTTNSNSLLDKANINSENIFNELQTFSSVNINNASIDSIIANSIMKNNSEILNENEINNKIQEIYNNLSQYSLFVWKGQWNNTTSYNEGWVVIHNNVLWISNSNNNVGNEPNFDNNTHWNKFTNSQTINLDNYYDISTIQHLYYDKIWIDNNVVKLSGNQTVRGEKTFENTTRFRGSFVEFGTDIRMGYGAAVVRITPEDNTKKRLSIKNGNRWFNIIDLENVAKIHNSVDPTGPQDLANKRYVDNQDNALSTRITNLENNDYTINTWNDNIVYKLGQQVYYDDEFYISTQNDNSNHQPNISLDYWKLLTTQQWVNDQNFVNRNDLNDYVLTSTLTNNYRDNNWIDNNVVKLSGNQVITGQKEYQSQYLMQKFTAATGSLKFKKTNNDTLLEIGKLESNSDKAWISTDIGEITLRSYNGGNVVVDNRNNLWISKAPTHNNHATNKSYVDNAITPVSTKANSNEVNINNLTNRVTTLENNSNSSLLYKKVIDFSINDNWNYKSWNNNKTTLTAKINLLNYLNQTQIDNLINVLYKSTSIPSVLNKKDVAISYHIEENELVFKLQTTIAVNGASSVFKGIITLIFTNGLIIT